MLSRDLSLDNLDEVDGNTSVFGISAIESPSHFTYIGRGNVVFLELAARCDLKLANGFNTRDSWER